MVILLRNKRFISGVFKKKTINMGKFRLHILVLLIFAMLLGSCTPQYQVTREQRKQERRLERRYRESERILEQGRQRHYNMQTPETQRHMGANRIRSQQWNARGAPFYVRWYWSTVSLFKQINNHIIHSKEN